ncbi:MAG: 3-deoxy-7-phosphoheptulonate synthase, partial [Mesorhizobium sp.]
SITDGCIDWTTTETVLHGLADAVERRRSARRAMIDSRPGAA